MSKDNQTAASSISPVPSPYVPHDHREYVDGCFRCDLSRDELGLAPPRSVDVSSLLFQCPKCGTPVDVVSLVGTDGRDAIVDVAPCAHTVVLSIEP